MKMWKLIDLTLKEPQTHKGKTEQGEDSRKLLKTNYKFRVLNLMINLEFIKIGW